MTLVAPPQFDADALIGEARAARHRRWRRNGVVSAALVAAVAALVVAAGALGGHGGTSPQPPVTAPHPTGPVIAGTWERAGPTVWAGGSPPNFALAQASSVSCAGGGGSACYVEVQAYGYGPDGAPTGGASLPPGLSPFTTAAYRSGDGGSTWTILPIPAGTYLSSPISCADASLCAVGARTATSVTAQLGQGAAVLTTRDSGRSWQVHPLPQGVGLVTSVACPNATRCVAVADDSIRATVDGMEPSDGAYAFYVSSVLTTTDGGRTWTPSVLPGRSGDSYLTLGAVSCPTAANCIVTGGRATIVPAPETKATPAGTGLYVSGTETGVELSSLDGGRTFTSHTLSAVPAAVSCPTAASCLALARGAQAGEADVLAGSISGGWHTATATGLPADVADGSVSMACPAAGNCLVVGAGQVYVTADGGRSWQPGQIVGGTTSTGGPSGATVASGACTSSGRCLLLGYEPASGLSGPGHLSVLVNGTGG